MAVSTSGRATRRLDDRSLAGLAADGKETAFEELYERHHRGLLSLARHILGSREEAEDAVQHTFGVAFRELRAGRTPGHMRAWLYATARNRCLDVLRGRREVPAEHVPDRAAGLPEEVERRADLRALLDDLGRLPEEQRTALVLSQLGDLEHTEVAEVIGCRPDKVRALVFQARSALSGWREARNHACRDVREHIASSHGGALRRAPLRRHLELCPDCAAFRDEVVEQRRRVALVLPVIPTVALKASVLDSAAAGLAGGAAAGAGGGAAGAGMAGGGAAAGAAGSAAAGAALGAGSLGAAAVKLGATALVIGGVGVASVGGLPGGGPSDDSGGSPARPAEARAERRADDRTSSAAANRLRAGQRTADAAAPDEGQATAAGPSVATAIGGPNPVPASGTPVPPSPPEQPAAPEPPAPPDAPSTPDSPEAPETPDAPGAPDRQAPPEEPEAPGAPDGPAPPEVPDEPGPRDTPEPPDTPTAPNPPPATPPPSGPPPYAPPPELPPLEVPPTDTPPPSVPPATPPP